MLCISLLLDQVLDFDVVIQLRRQVPSDCSLVVEEAIRRSLLLKLREFIVAMWTILVEVVVRVLLFVCFFLEAIWVRIWKNWPL